MAYIYILVAITAVLSVVVVALENKGILALKYVLKTVASLCFVMIALLSMAKGGYDNWKILVIAGLVFGMLGDIFLSSNNVVADKKTLGVLTIAGGLFFAVGHVIYVVWLLRFVKGFNYYTLFAVFGIPALFVVLSLLKVMKAGKITPLVTLYAAFLGTMLMGAINVYVFLSPEKIASLILAGGILFTTSDLVLAYYNFGHTEQTKVKYIYMTTYYAAQILFALTLLY